MSQADRIRAFVADTVLAPARRRGDAVVRVNAGEVVRAMALKNRTPAVCSALSAQKFLRQYGLALEGPEGPVSLQSTTVTFTYRLEPLPQPAATDDWFQSLHGLLRGAFDDVGGSEAYLRREREGFYGPHDAPYSK